MKTKILATMGPGCDSPETILELAKAGMTIARRNFSHARYDEVEQTIERVNAANEALGTKVAVLQDLCGPRIRIGMIPNDEMPVEEGQEIVFYTTDAQNVQDGELEIRDAFLHNDLKVGDHVLIDSGKFKTEVTAIDAANQRITLKFLNGGKLESRKGINVPNVRLTTASPTEKDKEDIIFGKEHGIKHVAISFVRDAQDIKNVRALLDDDQFVWSKVEEPIGVANIDEIIEASDGIIVARGDLGIEVAMEEIPFIQKMMVKKCNEAGKPVMVATQMLATMVFNPRPTRAEVSDIANAVLDGADYLWLSEESAQGKYPVEAVKMLAKVATRSEKYLESGE
jgi:pyruvate kinase